MNRPSVILPTTRQYAQIEPTISSILGSARDMPMELVIVFNGDSRPATIGKASALGIETKVVYEPTAGLLPGRHRGLQEATGEICVFVDDDILVSSTWLSAIVKAFEDPQVAMVGGPCLPQYAHQPPEWLDQFWHKETESRRWCVYLSLLDYGADRCEIDPFLIWGLNFAIRRSVLESVDGFHPDGVPWQLRRFRGDGESAVSAAIKAMGLKALYIPEAGVHHQVPTERLTLEYFCKRAFSQGISDSYTQLRKIYRDCSVVQRVWQRCRMSMRQVRHKHLRRQRSSDSSAKLQVQRAYWDGFAYHQREFAEDTAVRNWVLQDHYWDYSYPLQEKAAA